jgi:hypothetical protein
VEIMTEQLLLPATVASILAIIMLMVPWRRNAARRVASANNTELARLRREGRYRGVTIRPGKCVAARKYSGQIFSFDNAPRLPLPGCSERRCTCRYQGVLEHRRRVRRMEHDRREDIRFETDHNDRRGPRDRRRGSVRWLDPND